MGRRARASDRGIGRASQGARIKTSSPAAKHPDLLRGQNPRSLWRVMLCVMPPNICNHGGTAFDGRPARAARVARPARGHAVCSGSVGFAMAEEARAARPENKPRPRNATGYMPMIDHVATVANCNEKLTH